tara:strand:- start:3939 stop:4451 length:513 start_codon:yes stop_codon:yes gene_type:complete
MSLDPNTLQIRLYPDPCLRSPTTEVDPGDPDVKAAVDRMIELMFQANGAGLAAPQVGLPWRLFVTRDPADEDSALVWMNPVVTPLESPMDADIEGCLSLPEIEVEMTRPSKVMISAVDHKGERFEEESEVLARVWQHEMDHLEGVLIIDRMTTMERIKNRKPLKALKKSS